MEGVECESKASQEELEIKAKKNEIKGTNFMYLKNCMNNVLTVDAKDGKIDIPANAYMKFEPSSSAKYGKVVWKKSTGFVEK